VRESESATNYEMICGVLSVVEFFQHQWMKIIFEQSKGHNLKIQCDTRILSTTEKLWQMKKSSTIRWKKTTVKTFFLVRWGTYQRLFLCTVGKLPKIKSSHKLPKRNQRNPRNPSLALTDGRNLTWKCTTTKSADKECKNDTNGSNTSRAVCDKLSPKRESDLDVDLNSIQSRSHTDTESDQDE
jgi:hypothetical protein